MNKDKFNSLNIHDKVEYINSNIDKYGSVPKICEDIGINIDTFRNSIRNIYTYIPIYQRYIKIEILDNALRLANEDISNEVMVLNASQSTQSISLHTALSEVENPQERLISLLRNSDKILELIENASKPTQSIHSDSNTFMDLNMPSTTLKKTTIRVNEEIWNAWKKCIETEFSHLEQFDLLSVALRDFTNKYSLENK